MNSWLLFLLQEDFVSDRRIVQRKRNIPQRYRNYVYQVQLVTLTGLLTSLVGAGHESVAARSTIVLPRLTNTDYQEQ